MATTTIRTWDGVSLAYSQTGAAGAPDIVLIPGWCQTAAQWRKQVDILSQTFRVTAYDHRGHGESEQITRGFRISRLGADLHDLLVQLDLKDVVLIGHSMGCSVIWAYWDLFADSRNRIKKIILVDQPPRLTTDPTWSEGEGARQGTIFSATQPYEIAAALNSEGRDQVLAGMLAGMYTKGFPQDDLPWLVAQSSRVQPLNAGALLVDHAKNDWRDVIETLSVPVMIVNGEVSNITPPPAAQWEAEHIPGSRLHVFFEADGGSHFMFWENPTKFNKLVTDFILEGLGGK